MLPLIQINWGGEENEDQKQVGVFQTIVRTFNLKCKIKAYQIFPLTLAHLLNPSAFFKGEGRRKYHLSCFQLPGLLPLLQVFQTSFCSPQQVQAFWLPQALKSSSKDLQGLKSKQHPGSL